MTPLARAQIAFQQQLEADRALRWTPDADLDLVVEVGEDLMRARRALEVAWLEAA